MSQDCIFRSRAEQPAARREAAPNLIEATQLNLADTALRLARKSGAGYADFRIGCNEEEVIHARERRLERFNSTISAGFGIRVLLHGSWGFASSQTIEEKEIERVVGLAIENAEANRMIQTVPILLEDLPAYQDDWVMPMRIDPFTIPADEKASRLLAINDAGAAGGCGLLQFDPPTRS